MVGTIEVRRASHPIELYVVAVQIRPSARRWNRWPATSRCVSVEPSHRRGRGRGMTWGSFHVLILQKKSAASTGRSRSGFLDDRGDPFADVHGRARHSAAVAASVVTTRSGEGNRPSPRRPRMTAARRRRRFGGRDRLVRQLVRRPERFEDIAEAHRCHGASSETCSVRRDQRDRLPETWIAWCFVAMRRAGGAAEAGGRRGEAPRAW